MAATIVLIPQVVARHGDKTSQAGGSVARSDPRADIARWTVRRAVILDQSTCDIGVPVTRQPTDTDIKRYKARMRAALSEYFDEGELQNQLTALDRVAVAVTDPTFRSTGGGAHTFSSTESRADNIYRVKGSARTWASMAQVQDGGRLVEARPIGFIDFTIDVRVPPGAKHGKVIRFDWDFQPGSSP